MVMTALQTRPAPTVPPEAQLGPLVTYLRSVVLFPQDDRERCHALFVDARRSCLGDAGIGRGGRRGQLLHTGFAGPDHPMLLQLAESAYLKALFFRLN